MITVGLVSLGCAKNQVDSEVMLGLLRRRGFEVTHRPERADVIVVNTCGFLEAAKMEGYSVIREMAAYKKTGRCRRLVVAGCLVQRRAGEMTADLPEVDSFLALNDVERILEACDPEAGRVVPDLSPAVWMPEAGSPRLLTTPGPSAYLKISEGCDNPCSFCVIPQIRGRFRSRPIESLVIEARALAEAGVKELNLIAQDSTSYGSDLGIEGGAAPLLEALSGVDGIEWIRLLYAYPNKVDRRLIEALATTPKVLPYLDVPLQHASKTVLSRMRRGGSRESFARLIAEMRRRIPALSLRTTLIVGFPGETDAEFEDLKAFVDETAFDHIGVFTYSHEEGAPSHALADDVPADVKRERYQTIVDLQEGIAAGAYARRVGTTLSVLVEGKGPERGTLQGRAAFQAPEVDGEIEIRLEAGARRSPGDFLDVTVDEAMPYRLLGRPAVPARV